MKVYTIGFTKKTAQEFFGILDKNSIRKLIDVRLNNSSQLAGFTKGKDLKYFLKVICDIEYEHNLTFAPSKEILERYKKKQISWNEYESLFISLLNERKCIETLNLRTNRDYSNICLLCSEFSAINCHRRLVAEYIKEKNPDLGVEIIHL